MNVTTKDWLKKPVHFCLWWLMPIAIAVGADKLAGPKVTILVWALALAWMGVGCLLNAQRCHRRHCYLAGPILLAGALITGLQALEMLSFGPNGLNMTLWVTFALALLSFVSEIIWGKTINGTSGPGSNTIRKS